MRGPDYRFGFVQRPWTGTKQNCVELVGRQTVYGFKPNPVLHSRYDIERCDTCVLSFSVRRLRKMPNLPQFERFQDYRPSEKLQLSGLLFDFRKLKS